MKSIVFWNNWVLFFDNDNDVEKSIVKIETDEIIL
jgi:hypothetical protein